MSSLVSLGQGLGLISSWLKYIVRGVGESNGGTRAHARGRDRARGQGQAQSLLYTNAPVKPFPKRLRPACRGRRSFDGEYLAGLCVIGGSLHAVPLPCHEEQRFATFATEHTGEASPV